MASTITLPNIRRARIDDEPQVFNLFSRLTSRKRTDQYRVDQKTGPSIYRRIIENPDLGVILVAEDIEKILGVITLSYPVAIRCSGPYARIEEYIVDEANRGRGIGGMLLDAAIKEARKMNCFDLQVNNPSELGRPLYLNRGFEDGGEYMRLKL
jgi:GNAT superfamily N-acetyltransferase